MSTAGAFPIRRRIRFGASASRRPGMTRSPRPPLDTLSKEPIRTTLLKADPDAVAVWQAAQRLDAGMPWRYSRCMRVEPKRTTVYLDPEIHQALRFKAAESRRSMSSLVNEAVRLNLAEDAEDIAAFRERRGEPNLSFAEVVEDLKLRGKI